MIHGIWYDASARDAFDETSGRIQAIAEIHKHLYTSGDVTSVSLDQYMTALLSQLEQTLSSQGHPHNIWSTTTKSGTTSDRGQLGDVLPWPDA